MRPWTRRTVLRLGGAITAGGLAGCSTIRRGEPSRLGKLTAENFDTEPHVVSVLLLEGETPAYWARRSVPAARGDSVGGAVFEDHPPEPVDYVLYARVDDHPRSEWGRFDFGEHDAPCLGIVIQIGDVTEATDDPTIWYTTDPAVCQGGTDPDGSPP